MKARSRFVGWRVCAGVVVLLASLAAMFAENWQSIELRLPPARVGHYFTLEIDGTGYETFFASGLYPEFFSSDNWVQLTPIVDLDRPWQIVEGSTGDWLPLSYQGVAPIDARELPWNYAGPPRQYFLLSEDRGYHTVVLAQGGSFHPVTTDTFSEWGNWPRSPPLSRRVSPFTCSI